MKAQFIMAAMFATKAFTAKLNFVNATAKRLNIKKGTAHEIADKIEGETQEQIDLALFKTKFIEAATTHVKEQLIAKTVVTPTHKAKIAELVAETPAVEPAKVAKAKTVKKAATKKVAVLETV